MTEPAKDQELIDLLSSLSPQKTITLDTSNPNPPKVEEPPPPVEEPPPQEEPSIPSEDEEAPPVIVEKPPIVEPELIPASPPEIEPVPEAALAKIPPPTPDQVQFRQLLVRFQNSVNLIAENQVADREQIEKAIVFYEQQVKNGALTALAARPFVEGWVALLGTKAEINANATSLLDSISKLLAAGKANDLVNINIGGKAGSGDFDLEKLLGQPLKEDEKPKP